MGEFDQDVEKVNRIEDVFHDAGGEFVKMEDFPHYGGICEGDASIVLHTRTYLWRFPLVDIELVREEYVPAPGTPLAKTKWVSVGWGCRVYNHSKDRTLLSDIDLTGVMEAIEAHLKK